MSHSDKSDLNSKDQAKCCDGKGQVLSEEQMANFENSMSKNRHHFYNEESKGKDGLSQRENHLASRHHVLEYQRCYNKFTPTPMP